MHRTINIKDTSNDAIKFSWKQFGEVYLNLTILEVIFIMYTCKIKKRLFFWGVGAVTSHSSKKNRTTDLPLTVSILLETVRQFLPESLQRQ